jgi:NAD(P)H-flavin reductase
MEFAKPEQFKVRVSDTYFVSENEEFLYIKFELVSPDCITFESGQYVSIRVNELGERRSYSIANTPDDTHGFHIVAKIIPGGKGSEYLKSLKNGAEIELLAPLGRFVAQPQLSDKLLFVATGSGIVPIYSIITDLLINKHETKPIRLHWGLRDESHMFWFDNFERLMGIYPNFVFDPVLSRPSQDWSLCSGHVQDCLMRDFGEKKLAEWQGYVCGNPTMVEEVSAKLVELGMNAELVHHEKFV